jgi:acetyltransferase-like isoleucine patch superfamily enzyme
VWVDKHRVQEAYWAAWRVRRSATRALFIARARATAWSVNSQIDFDIAPDVLLPRDATFIIKPGTASRIRIGSGTRIDRGFTLRLTGGQLDMGSHCEVRRDVTLTVTGRLSVGSRVMLGSGMLVMCDERLTIEQDAIIGSYTVISDTTHRRTAPDEPVHHSPMRTAPTRIGRNVQIGVHVAVSLGVDVGDQAFIGANSVVTSDVPAGWLAVGSPARAVRELVVGE